MQYGTLFWNTSCTPGLVYDLIRKGHPSLLGSWPSCTQKHSVVKSWDGRCTVFSLMFPIRAVCSELFHQTWGHQVDSGILALCALRKATQTKPASIHIVPSQISQALVISSSWYRHPLRPAVCFRNRTCVPTAHAGFLPVTWPGSNTHTTSVEASACIGTRCTKTHMERERQRMKWNISRRLIYVTEAKSTLMHELVFSADGTKVKKTCSQPD